MRTHRISVLLFLLALVLFPQPSFAQLIMNTSPQIPFGGRVISLSVPTVTCETTRGRAPVVLSANLASAATALFSASGVGNQSVGERTVGVIGGIYGAIPLYTQSYIRVPRIGDWILGKHDLIPDIATCQTNAFGVPIPFPVKPTTNFGISDHGGL